LKIYGHEKEPAEVAASALFTQQQQQCFALKQNLHTHWIQNGIADYFNCHFQSLSVIYALAK
jgi:hypothetical protein